MIVIYLNEEFLSTNLHEKIKGTYIQVVAVDKSNYL